MEFPCVEKRQLAVWRPGVSLFVSMVFWPTPTDYPRLIGGAEETMLKLLLGPELPNEFRTARKRSPKTRLAVAFWGKGAVTRLGLRGGPLAQIICNAVHPGCNPKVILELVQKGHEVRTNDHLHAKMYLTDKIAIIGSSNVSTNGLDEEDASSAAWHEANVFADDPGLVKHATAEFVRLWKQSRPIKEPELNELIEAWKARPRRQSIVTTPFLLKAARKSPELFKNVGIITWDRNIDKDVREFLEDKKAAMQPAKDGDITETDIRRAEIFQFETDVPAGWYFSFNCKSDSPKYCGLFWIDMTYKVADDDYRPIGIKRRAILLPGGQTMKLTAEDRAYLLKHIGAIYDSKELTNGFAPLADALKVLDRKGIPRFSA